MSTYPRLHSIEFGEGVLWTPPAGAATFFVWYKQVPDDSAPRWVQARGYNLATHAPIVIPDQVTALSLGGGGVTGSWQALIALFDGFDNEVVLVTAQDAAGKLISSDRYALPSPNSTDAASMAAQERKLLQTLLVQRANLAEVGGHAKVSTPDGTMVERVSHAAIDRRVAEVRARVRWFELAAAGNTMPRAEHW